MGVPLDCRPPRCSFWTLACQECGYELARRLCPNSSMQHTMLVALTGYGRAHSRVLSRATRVFHHFVKPIDMTQLMELLVKLNA